MTSSPAPSVMVLLTPLVITRWYVGATAAVTMLTLFSTLLSLLLWVPDSVSRPADVLLPNWINGRPAALGIHVISSLQSLTLSEAARTQGHALQVGVQHKLASNLPSCRSVGLTCIPLVAETLGGLAEDFVSTIRDIGRSICLRSGTDRDIVTTKHLFGRVSIALWRGNATMRMGIPRSTNSSSRLYEL